MDANLKRLAEVSLAVGDAETAVDDAAFHTATERLDAARVGLEELREAWPEMDAAERRVVGAAAAPVRRRLDATAARVPKLSAVSEMSGATADPEQETEPEEGAG